MKRKKNLLIKCFTSITFLLLFQLPFILNAQLAVSENGRYLENPDGTPFYWLGDTGWALFQKLDREDVEYYFKIRAAQGFSVIHAAVYHKNPFVLPPLSNMYGDMAFIEDDLTKPIVTPGNNLDNEAEYDYWDHVEYVIDKAEENGLYINFLPVFGVAEGDGYNIIDPGNAYAYGKFIGRRFKDKKNIIWCMGGDVLADNELRKSVWDLLAKGVTVGVAGEEDYSKTLMTYHVRGGHSSTEYFPDAPWLDFHMLQTWASYTKIYNVVTADYNLTPVKPILHGEGAYEDGPEYPTKPINPHVIRKQAYWAIYAGGYHTYGNSNVWNFGTNPYYVSQDWKAALRSPGALCLTISRAFFESLDWWTYIPDQSIITEGIGSGNTLNVAMRSSDNNSIIVYFSSPTSAAIDLNSISESGILKAVWIDPRTGEKSELGSLKKGISKTFTTPDGWEDALLMIEVENQ